MASSSYTSDDRPEIAFFDVETTIPTRLGQGFALLEFGAILVCPRTLMELHSYSTLIRPSDLSLITSLSVRCNGISPDSVSTAPPFSDVADTVFDLLHGRIWAGHNILRFDCPRIREAFAEIGRSPPEPKGAIDSLALLTQKFGRRAGNMKMASLATYFGLGNQTHRSLDDVRMNLEVVKYCATVLFLESSLSETLPEKSWVSPNVTSRSRRTGKSIIDATVSNENGPSSSNLDGTPVLSPGVHPISSLITSSIAANGDPFDLSVLKDEMNMDALERAVPMEEIPVTGSAETPPDSNHVETLHLDEVSVPSIRAAYVPYPSGGQRIKLLHKNAQFELYCPSLKVRFGLSTKFVDRAGRPRLSYVVDASLSLCRVLDACNELALNLFQSSGSESNWRHVVVRHDKYSNYPNLRINIPTSVEGNSARYATEMYQKEQSGTVKKLDFSKFDPEELEPLLMPGTLVDAYISLDTYDYQNSAGIRLVAKRLVIYSEQKQKSL